MLGPLPPTGELVPVIISYLRFSSQSLNPPKFFLASSKARLSSLEKGFLRRDVSKVEMRQDLIPVPAS